MLVDVVAFADELGKIAKEDKKKGSLGKALAIGTGTALAVGTGKGIAEKAIEPAVEKKVRKALSGISKKRKMLRRVLKRAPWPVARGLTSALAASGYTLGTLKAVEAARGK